MNVKTAIALGVFLSLFFFNFFLDLFEIFVDFVSVSVIGAVLQTINTLFDFLVGVITTIFLFAIGGRFVSVRLIAMAIGQLAEFIPGLDILPIRTVALLINMLLYFILEDPEEIIKQPEETEGETEEMEEEQKEENIQERVD